MGFSVTGTVTALGPLTDTQLRATPVPVSGEITIPDAATSEKQDEIIAALPTLTSDGGVPVESMELRRRAEMAELQAYATHMQMRLNTERQTSHRMGVELR